ncbi:unnamed protein product, partial [Linum tenue]
MVFDPPQLRSMATPRSSQEIPRSGGAVATPGKRGFLRVRNRRGPGREA